MSRLIPAAALIALLSAVAPASATSPARYFASDTTEITAEVKPGQALAGVLRIETTIDDADIYVTAATKSRVEERPHDNIITVSSGSADAVDYDSAQIPFIGTDCVESGCVGEVSFLIQPLVEASELTIYANVSASREFEDFDSDEWVRATIMTTEPVAGGTVVEFAVDGGSPMLLDYAVDPTATPGRFLLDESFSDSGFLEGGFSRPFLGGGAVRFCAASEPCTGSGVIQTPATALLYYTRIEIDPLSVTASFGPAPDPITTFTVDSPFGAESFTVPVAIEADQDVLIWYDAGHGSEFQVCAPCDALTIERNYPIGSTDVSVWARSRNDADPGISLTVGDALFQFPPPTPESRSGAHPAAIAAVLGVAGLLGLAWVKVGRRLLSTVTHEP